MPSSQRKVATTRKVKDTRVPPKAVSSDRRCPSARRSGAIWQGSSGHLETPNLEGHSHFRSIELPIAFPGSLLPCLALQNESDSERHATQNA